jgi:hypothetical protein
MRPVGWFNLLPDLATFPSPFDPRATLSTEQVEQFEGITRTAEDYTYVLIPSSPTIVVCNAG